MKRAFTIFLFVFLISSGYATEIRLKEKLAEAQPGSYLVLEQNKTFTFLHICDRFDHRIILEETSIPAASFARHPMNWKTWFESGAPSHTAWIMSQVNLETGVFEETYSFTHQGWVNRSESNPFLTTLLNLKFHELSLNERRRVGLPPGYNKPDHRPLWNPRLIVNGQMLANAPFSAFKARWPSDGSDLSRKKIEIYLPQSDPNVTPFYPTYFPFWLEVDGKLGSAKVRIIDSGMGAKSPKNTMPKRQPQLVSEEALDNDDLVFRLRSPIYYRDFVIVAESTEGFFGKTFLVPCDVSIKGELVSLSIAKEQLNNLALQGEFYRFSISPKEDPSIILQTRTRSIAPL